MEAGPYSYGHETAPSTMQYQVDPQQPHRYSKHNQFTPNSSRTYRYDAYAHGPSSNAQGTYQPSDDYMAHASMTHTPQPHQQYYQHAPQPSQYFSSQQFQYFPPAGNIGNEKLGNMVPLQLDILSDKLANTLDNCMRDGIVTALQDGMTPFMISSGLSLIHHLKNRKAETISHFRDSKYSRYRDNILFSLATYQFMKVNGVVKIKDKYPIPANGEPPVGVRRPNQSTPRGINTSSSTGGNLADDLDDYWIVPQDAAARYYTQIYDERISLCDTNAQMIGGAAAIWALKNRRCRRAERQDPTEQMVMGMALDEAESLLAHKAAVSRLGPDDTIEIVGRHALATVIDRLVAQ